jgi:hypothetical protein
MDRNRLSGMAAVAAALLQLPADAAAPDAALLFRVSADHSLTADQADGDAEPNFLSHVSLTPNGKSGSAIRWEDDGVVSWNAPGNIYGRRGTLSFFWRSRESVGVAPFVIFRVGFADHTSWDMTFLRIDWNGHGFDAFVTDTNLARVRVSFDMKERPAPEAWRHIAFAWDETIGVRLYVDGREVARQDQKADLDTGLDQFGLAGRVMSPHQVQSRYNFTRGSDLDEIRVYDRMLGAPDVAALANLTEPAAIATPVDAATRQAWLHRYGWDAMTPPALDAPVTRIRKVEFATARDLKEEMRKGIDGIDETTWPGVYNRSRLPGRDDYFELPDWNVYVEGGKTYDLAVPASERFNRIELRGAAYGALSYAADGSHFAPLATRRQGVLRSLDQFASKKGGALHFTNAAQETPIQEIWAYDVVPGAEPEGTFKLSYTVRADAAPSRPQLADLVRFIDGRYPPEERTAVLAIPSSGGKAAASAGDPTNARKRVEQIGAAPIVHILIPSGFGDAPPAEPLARAWNYGWENVHDGLDGIAIDIPALDASPNKNGLIPLDIRVKDPIWPMRDMIDVQVAVRPHEARTVWLDLRDRILTADPFYLSIASAASDFGAKTIDGMKIRLVFKDREAAKAEHVADRFNQVKDNWGFLVEEHTASKREALYARVYADISDLLRVDPENVQGRLYWQDISYNAQSSPIMPEPQPVPGVPLWAFRQLEDLKLVKQFVNWWIDNRQVPYGDFGGGISDDVDLTQQWPALALMGVEPDKINTSLRALSDAVYKNGMRVNGLGYITTDELHAYEEGLNSDAERLYLNWGEPKAVERVMAAVKALTNIITVNPTGHMHFSSNWYGGRTVYREGPWEWQKPYSFVVMHSPILIGLYNGNPVARNLVTGVMDGWLAHGKKGANGLWSFPNEINWRTDAERVGDGGGSTTPLQSAWAAWRFTGDTKYLRPFEARVAANGAGAMGEINENEVGIAASDPGLGKLMAAKPAKSELGLYSTWNRTGDLKPLEQLHADAIQDKLRHMYMMTEGHWWSDRVELKSDILQRERLGGIANARGLAWPGNTVSWRFDKAGAAEQVAILLPGATRDHFKVIAYNSSDEPLSAIMTSWNVTAGRWRASRATEGASDAHELDLERSTSTRLSFAPHAATTFEFTLIRAGQPVEQRPDIGIGADDVRVTGRTVRLTVHSLGSVDTPAGTATVEDAGGHLLATTAIPPIAAPRDLTPRTVDISLRLAQAIPAGASVRVKLVGGAAEITQLNNAVPLAR